ncbi:MAG: hypothetical protein KY468_17750, partial [Armatimonadetes bacterium]|nr:hypothetical protein [Armatimonadota bacterium]
MKKNRHSREGSDVAALQASLYSVSVGLDQKIAALEEQLNRSQTLGLRAQIEVALSEGKSRISLFYLPADQGGHLEFVREIAGEVLQKNALTGNTLRRANAEFTSPTAWRTASFEGGVPRPAGGEEGLHNVCIWSPTVPVDPAWPSPAF